jgi:hypothetical protein
VSEDSGSHLQLVGAVVVREDFAKTAEQTKQQPKDTSCGDCAVVGVGCSCTCLPALAAHMLTASSWVASLPQCRQ